MTAYPLLSRVCAITPQELAEALDLEAYQELIDAEDLEQLEAKVERDELERFDRLVDLILRPDIREAMGIASAHALRDVEKYRNGRGRRFRYGARLQRSVIGYTTRSALKPSPFSHFTRLGHEGDQCAPIVDEMQAVPTHATASGLASGFDEARTAEPEDAVVNPTLRRVDGQLLGWRAQYLVDGGFAWRSDEIVDGTPWVDGDGDVDELPAVGAEDRALQLMDGTASFANDVDRISSDRSTARRRIDPVIAMGFNAATRPELPATYHVVTEQRVQPRLDGSPAVPAIEAWLRGRLRMVSTYTDMVGWARAEFGDGVEVDLAEFLIRSMLKFEEATPRMQMRPPTAEELADDRFAPPMAAVFWQRCPSVGSDVVVANNSNGPGLGAALRWGGSIAEQSQTQLRRVEESCNIELLPFTFGDEWNGIQTCGDAAFTWPSGRRVRRSDLPLASMRVRVRGNGIDVLRDGRRVVPVYAGAMPEHRITGTARIFGLLGHPWAFEFDRSRPTEERWERMVESDSLITRRAGALLQPDQIRHLKGLPLAQALIELHRWSQENGVGSACFWKVSSDVPSAESAKRKPSFVDFASPHLVAGFLQTASGDDPLIVEEALPNSRTAVDATEEFVSLFVLDDERTP